MATAAHTTIGISAGTLYRGSPKVMATAITTVRTKPIIG